MKNLGGVLPTAAVGATIGSAYRYPGSTARQARSTSEGQPLLLAYLLAYLHLSSLEVSTAHGILPSAS